MPEQRGRKYHQERVAETLRDEIGAMIEGQLSDPRISFAYVSQVVINPGGKSALIYVAVDGGLQKRGKQGTGNREQGTGSREPAAGSREQETGNR